MNFVQHAQSYGLVIKDLINDGQWHRCATIDHPHKRNGAYAFDGERGAVQNWATMQDVALFRPDGQERVSRDLYRQHTKKAFEAEHAKHIAASATASALIRECVRGTHAYLASKGFPETQGLVHPNGDLVIPMRDFKNYGVVNSIQRIATDGSKRFLPGGKAKGSVFVIAKGAWRERWLCEGYATALSVQLALLDLRRQAEVICCFSAGNLRYIAQFVKRPAYVMADNDESETGADAAKATDLPWTIPNEVGMDANDLHQTHGLRALVKVMQDLRAG